MKKKFLAVFSIVFVMAFAVAVFAFNQSSAKTAAESCAMKDDCPLKGKNAETAGMKTDGSCCDKADCCCKTGACPMKAKDEKSADCCDNCCGGSCPMKEKQSAANAVQAENEKASQQTGGV